MSKKTRFKIKTSEADQQSISLRKPVICSACRETSFLHPKGFGYQPYIWEMNCNLCHRYHLSVNAYIPEHKQLYAKLNQLRDQYFESKATENQELEIIKLAEEYDKTLDNRLCECGGQISISAKPKCIFCDIEIMNNYFYYADES